MSTFANHPEPYPEEAKWRAWGVKATDGDTIVVNPDQGFGGTTRDIQIRLADPTGARFDAPEIVGSSREAGLAARDFTESLVGNRAPLRCVTRRFRRSFVRYIGVVEYYADGQWHELTQAIRQAGHAL